MTLTRAAGVSTLFDGVPLGAAGIRSPPGRPESCAVDLVGVAAAGAWFAATTGTVRELDGSDSVFEAIGPAGAGTTSAGFGLARRTGRDTCAVGRASAFGPNPR